MAIKAISEFTVQPGRRDEFVSLFESLVAQHISGMREAGCLATTLYAVVDDPDRVVEIADWESAEARDAMTRSEAMAAFAAYVRSAGRATQRDGGQAAALEPATSGP